MSAISGLSQSQGPQARGQGDDYKPDIAQVGMIFHDFKVMFIQLNDPQTTQCMYHIYGTLNHDIYVHVYVNIQSHRKWTVIN